MQQHRDIVFPKLKEPRYFSSYNLKLPQQGPGDFSVDQKLITNLSTYEDLYRELDAEWVGDASSEYLYHSKDSAPKMYEVLGDVPVILILRNPVERAFSAYNNLIRDGRETKPFMEALMAEDERIEGNYDMMWHYKAVGEYSEHVKRYLDTFTKVKILFFEEFTQNPDEQVKQIFDFLGVKSDVTLDTSTRYSNSGKPKSALISLLTSRNNVVSNTVRRIIMALVPRSILEKVSEKSLEKSEVPAGARKYLKDYYQKEIMELGRVLDKDLSIWN